jgi:hypothetical protein
MPPHKTSRSRIGGVSRAALSTLPFIGKSRAGRRTIR